MPPSRQLLITDLGLESKAMRSATRYILNYIGWPENEDLVYVCRNCYDWLRFKSDLWWKNLVQKYFRCIFVHKKLWLVRELKDDEWEEWEDEEGGYHDERRDWPRERQRPKQ